MAVQTTFERYELKYMMTKEVQQQLLEDMKDYMQLDMYGHTTIRNIYYDTDSYRLIRRSLEKPSYKEKLRIRSYAQTKSDDPVFVELKKKYNSIVYKRRLTIADTEAQHAFSTGEKLPVNSQIGDEIEYFRDFYETLKPAVFLSYERDAYFSLDGSDFRVTFDSNILYRTSDFSLGSDIYGYPLLDDDAVLMEIKTGLGMPLWMSALLAKYKIYRTSYSKYGSAYMDMMKNGGIENGNIISGNL